MFLISMWRGVMSKNFKYENQKRISPRNRASKAATPRERERETDYEVVGFGYEYSSLLF